MSQSKHVFLDTTPIIYYIQQNEIYFRTVEKIFYFLAENKVDFIASDITTAESLIHAYRYKKTDWLNNFDGLMKIFDVEILHTTEEISRKAAQISAKFNFELPDSIQLATAVISGCDIFLTNDKRLKKFDEVKCLLVDDFKFGDEK